MTDMINFHTCPIGGMDMLVAGVLVTDRKLLEVACDMIGGSGVHIPIGIDSVVRRGCRNNLLWWAGERSIEPLEAAIHSVALFSAELAEDALLEVLATSAATATASNSTATATVSTIVAATAAAM